MDLLPVLNRISIGLQLEVRMGVDHETIYANFHSCGRCKHYTRNRAANFGYRSKIWPSAECSRKIWPNGTIGNCRGQPLFANIPDSYSLSKITYEEALELFKLPATLGEYEGLPVQTNNGRYGPYILHNKIFVSLPKDANPLLS